MIGLCFMRVENGHIFGIEFVLAICVSFGGMFIGLFCLRAFIVRFTRPGGEPSTGHEAGPSNQYL
ncbi:hypothetical protein CIK84_15970 [Glutamicibacter arilaitensis]|uniref:Uncharacterized protein n=1 Tax=Glutamicibacter arilaitensis TaxID=256701 RepID=A0A2N7RYB4_9MICC|nr:hypothetical protein CIK84_15970 [Glutamicibacter arilaitensis]